ncbi:pseudouridine synthase [Saprospiraceae bacterium]|nr:pseudouridine synthase [Saprospiraceae bacterium]
MDISHLIAFENETIIGFNKPHGLLVHKSSIARDAKEFALQWVRDYSGSKVYLAHRLDRKTSGVLLFAKTEEENSYLQTVFRERKITKVYKALVRGYTDNSGVIDYALTNDRQITQDALTTYSTISRFEIPLETRTHPSSRYSLVRLMPETGRYHQLRKHMAHIRHPIIGDRPHGCNKQNRLWKEHFQMTTMLLHAESLEFTHKDYGIIKIVAPMSSTFSNTLDMLKASTIS